MCSGYTKYTCIPSWENKIHLGTVTTKPINQLEELISCDPVEHQPSRMVVAASWGWRRQLHPTCPAWPQPALTAWGGPASVYSGFVLGLRRDSTSHPKSRPKEVTSIPLLQESPFPVAPLSTGTSAVATHTRLLPAQPPGKLAASGAVSQ